MLRTFVLVASITALSTSAAMASQQQADQCATGLSAESKTIYDAVAPKVTPSTELRPTITDETRSLVMSGKVNRSTARDSAEEAGACLVKLKS